MGTNTEQGRVKEWLQLGYVVDHWKVVCLRPTSGLQCHPRASLSSPYTEFYTGHNRGNRVGACLSGPDAHAITSDGYRHA